MRKCGVFVLAVIGVLLGESAVEAQQPAKEEAVKTLRAFVAALEAKDYERALFYLQLPPDEKIDPEKELGGLLRRGEISRKGIDIIAAKGKWGKLTEIISAARVDRYAKQLKIAPESCYGFVLGDAEACLCWTGMRFTIFRVENIGKLK
jgi:hypothetical protein